MSNKLIISQKAMNSAILRVTDLWTLTAPDNGAISCSLGDNEIANVGESMSCWL